MASKNSFKIIIIGGSVSGLTMAHALERAGLEYIVLERGAEVTFNGGASIGLQPHGLRIMDQLGMYEDILKTTAPMVMASHRLPNGRAFAKSEFALQIEERHGYPILFFERAEMLQILYNHLPDKSKVCCSKKVVDIQSNSKCATATTADGTCYTADMIIGADGVNSFTRKMLWKIMAKTEPELVEKESTSMYSEYACAFGVSIYDSNDPELKPGYSHINYNTRRSHICIISTRKRKFWFLILKHKKRYYAPEIPRFTSAETESTVLANSDIRVTERTTLGELWRNMTKCSMVSLEEVVYDRWYEDRLVLLGDSVHKVTPNAGHGGNTAIESAAVLANLLYDAKVSKNGRSSLTHLGLLSIFHEYQANRMGRVANAFQKSSLATRIQAMDSRLWSTIALHILPIFGESMETNAASSLILGGVSLSFVEYKGKQGSIPWEGWKLADRADPELPNFFTAVLQKLYYLVLPLVALWVSQNYIASLAPIFDLSLTYGVAGVQSNTSMDGLWPWINAHLTASSTASISRTWTLLPACMNIFPIGAIMGVESFRGIDVKQFRGNILVSWAVFQLGGIGIVGPLYFLVHAICTNLSPGFHPRNSVVPVSEARLHPTAFLMSIATLICFTSAIPRLIWPLPGRIYEHVLALLLQTLPVLPSVMVCLLATLQNCSMSNPSPIIGHADLGFLQETYIISAVISAVFHVISVIYGLSTSSFRDKSLLRTSWTINLLLGGSQLNGVSRTNYISFISAAMVWVYCICRSAVPVGSRTVLFKLRLATALTVSIILVGPGATASIFWLWREDKTRCSKAAAIEFQKSLERN